MHIAEAFAVAEGTSVGHICNPGLNLGPVLASTKLSSGVWRCVAPVQRWICSSHTLHILTLLSYDCACALCVSLQCKGWPTMLRRRRLRSSSSERSS